MIGDIQEIQKGSPSYRVVTNGGCLGSSETVLMVLENNLGEDFREAHSVKGMTMQSLLSGLLISSVYLSWTEEQMWYCSPRLIPS